MKELFLVVNISKLRQELGLLIAAMMRLRKIFDSWIMDMIEISVKCYSLVPLQYQNLFSLLSKHMLEKECFRNE